MNDRSKRILFFIVSVAVAVSFISSYGAFNNNTTTIVNTTTSGSTKTFFVAGAANAVVTGYSSGITIALHGNSITTSQVSNALSLLEANGSISNYFELNNTFDVINGTMNAYGLQRYLAGAYDANSISVNASSLVRLPKTIRVNYTSTQALQILAPQGNFSITISPLLAVGANVPVTVHALITANGTIYNNQISVIAK